MTTKNQKVKGYSYRKRNGKLVKVKAHARKIKDERVTVTKKQYEARSKKKPVKTQKRDNARRKRNTLTVATNKLKPGWNTKNVDLGANFSLFGHNTVIEEKNKRF